MISALIGTVIMSAVTVAMLIAIRVTDNALNNVGKYPLTEDEKQILKDAGLDDPIQIKDINNELKDLIFNE